MPKQLIWSPESETDLLELWHWGARHFSQDIADNHLRDIDRAARNLMDFPESGRTRDELRKGLRSVIVFPTVVVYRIAASSVEIVRVVDGRRNLAAMFTENKSK